MKTVSRNGFLGSDGSSGATACLGAAIFWPLSLQSCRKQNPIWGVLATNTLQNVKRVMKKPACVLAAASMLATAAPASAHVYFGAAPWGLGIGVGDLWGLPVYRSHCYSDEYAYDRGLVKLHRNLPVGSVVIHLPDGSIVIRKPRIC